MEKVYLAGGCFWGVEELFRNQKGVSETRVGYTGGGVANPTYEIVKTGESGHAEALEVTFDPKILTYSALLEFFFSIHDPTTLNQQGNDRGHQYRSAIFYQTDSEKLQAQQTIEKINKENRWPRPIATTLEPFEMFYSAEDFHQKYLEKNPGGYTCHWQRYNPEN